MKNYYIRQIICSGTLAIVFLGGLSSGVTSKITRHSKAVDFLKGETENTIIDSEGSIRLARRTIELDCGNLLEDVWIINSLITLPDGTIYLGTSPNGDIIKYKDGKAVRIYPVDEEKPQLKNHSSPPAEEDPNQPEDPNSVKAEQLFTNEHVFAMAIDAGGRLLAGVSGSNCRVLRFDNLEPPGVETIFQPNDANEPGYILAITLDEMGNIYLGTGPKGRIYSLNPFGKNPKLIYDCPDNNILSLAVDKEGFIYAGCDQRGLVYKINAMTRTATVLFDSEQDEITALLLDHQNNLYATATSARAFIDQDKFDSISMGEAPGRPDTSSAPPEKKGDNEKTNDPMQLKIANTDKTDSASKASPPEQMAKGTVPKEASRIYKINPQGFVTNVFSEMAVFFAILEHDDNLLVGTGNKGLLFTINPETERTSITYEDEQASQITALSVAKEQIYLGTANPAKLIKLLPWFAEQGTYTSDLIDGGQPARWGKLQIDADIPNGYQILLSARSGNVKDPNDPTFSAWTEPMEVTEATELTCPVGRYCQYKLTLKIQNHTEESKLETNKSPVIRETAVSHVVMNLSPKVLSVNTSRSKDKKKTGVFNISYKAKDDNADKLIYEIEFRKVGRSNWIKLKDELTDKKYEWDSKTVEDGRYEVRVTADDQRSNTTTTKLTGSRISDPFVIDNTPPVIESADVTINGDTAIINLNLKDEFTAIGKVSYTVDSNEDWIGALPDDMVYDTTAERFTITIEDLETGAHVVALKISDDTGNTMYKTFDIDINQPN